MYRQLKRINERLTPEQVSQEMGIEQQSIEQAIEERGIRPRMIINGEPFFDPPISERRRRSYAQLPRLNLNRSCAPQQLLADSDVLLTPVSSKTDLTDYASAKTESAESVDLRSKDA